MGCSDLCQTGIEQRFPFEQEIQIGIERWLRSEPAAGTRPKAFHFPHISGRVRTIEFSHWPSRCMCIRFRHTAEIERDKEQ
jgi:hypothetical protein